MELTTPEIYIPEYTVALTWPECLWFIIPVYLAGFVFIYRGVYICTHTPIEIDRHGEAFFYAFLWPVMAAILVGAGIIICTVYVITHIFIVIGNLLTIGIKEKK